MSCRAARIKIVLVLLLLLAGRPAGALTNGVALLPPMGFNSFYSYGVGISEALIKSIGDTMATNGMLAAGYNYINIDDGWSGLRDTNGAISADTNKFPDGMKALVDYLHAKGFKVGLYTTASSNTCADYPGSENHIMQDANTYASWGIDYLKFEGCNISTYELYPHGQIYCARMSQALLHCGRPIVFSFSIGGAFENWMPQYINLWRGTGDINGAWSTILSHIDFVAQSPQAAGPGGWNDMDVLEIGSGAFADPQATALFSMWCMLDSPLLVLGSETIHTNILCNAEAIAVDQDPACIQAVCVSSNTNTQVWSKPLISSNSGTLAVALFNRGSVPANITGNWSDLKLTPGVSAVWDMWVHAYVGNFTNSYTANIGAEGIQLLKIVNGATIPLPPVGTNYVSDLPWMSDVSNVVTFPNNAPYNRDISGASTPMSLRGVGYSKGLGMNGYTRARYFLGGMATRFQSIIGVDDHAQGTATMIFRVYADGAKIYDSGNLTTQTQSVDLDLTGHTSMTIEVTNGIPSTANNFADWANARITFPALPPLIPGGLSASPGASQFAVTWYAESGATNYVLKRATSSGGPYAAIATNASPGYTDTNLAQGVTYYYVVSAVNASGASSNSTEVTATLPAYWANTQTGSAQGWNFSGNWTNTPVFPNRQAALAIISPAIVSSQTINLNQSIELGGLVLGVTNGSAAITLAANGGTFTLNNDNSAVSITDLATAAGDTVSAPIVLNNNLVIAANSTNFLTLAGAISGSASLTANGPGALLLSGSNSFAGPVSVNAGLLKIGNAAALGATNSGMALGGGSTLDLNGFSLGAKTVTVSGPGLGGNGAIISTGAAPQTNALNSLTLTGNTTLGGTTRWDIRGASNLTPSGVLSTGGNAFTLTKTGGNQISLASLTVDPALGEIDVNQGTLSFENATTSMGAPGYPLNVGVSATLSLVQTTNVWNKNIALNGDGLTPTIVSSGSNSISGPVNISGACLFNVTNGLLSLNSLLGGNGSLIKNLPGTLVLGGTNGDQFFGDVLVNDGTLAIQNASALSSSSPIEVVQGAELDVSALGSGLTLTQGQVLTGGGVVNGNVTLGNQSAIEPDDSFGMPTFNNSLAFSPGSTCIMEVIALPPYMSTELRVAGNLNFAGTLVVSNLLGNNFAAGNSFKLFNAAGYNGTFGAITPQIPGTNLIWDTSQLAVSGALNVVTGTLPRFTTFARQGGNLLFNGTGGGAGAPYYVLTTTNVTLPVSQWTRIATNHFDSSGNFTITNAPNLNTRALFYRVQAP